MSEGESEVGQMEVLGVQMVLKSVAVLFLGQLIMSDCNGLMR